MFQSCYFGIHNGWSKWNQGVSRNCQCPNNQWENRGKRSWWPLQLLPWWNLVLINQRVFQVWLRLWILLLVKIVIRADSLELERFYTSYWAPLNFLKYFYLLKVLLLKLCRSSVKAWALEFSSFSLIPSFLSFVWIILKNKIKKAIKEEIFYHVILFSISHDGARDKLTLRQNRMKMINDFKWQ